LTNTANELNTLEMILGNYLIISHMDNFIYESDIYEVAEYNDFIKWLIEVKELNDSKSHKEFIDSVIDVMGIYYPSSQKP